MSGVGAAAVFRHDCSEIESQYYMEEKLQR
jgi:hypothetical protein